MNSIFATLKYLAVFLLSFILFAEIGCWLYIRYFNQSIPLPTYKIVDARNKFWGNYNMDFGTWHRPNSSYLHNKSCFTIEYFANSLGMRDPHREMRSDEPRIALLGDSFAEGWGNEIGERMSDLLELELGHEVLNFSTSGGFGNIQEWMQYKHMVKNFDHDVVLVSFLPHNDFEDNDYEYATKYDEDRRPFLKGNYPDYELVYSKEKLRKRPHRSKYLTSFDFTIREWSSIYRVLRFLGSYRISNFELLPRWVDDHNKQKPHSSYHEFSKEQWDIVRYSLEQIVKEAEGRPVVVFSIATHPDFLEYDGTPPPLAQKLKELSQSTGFIYCDMLKDMAERHLDAEDIFFVCDNHWSPTGNALAAEVLKPYVKKALALAAKRKLAGKK